MNLRILLLVLFASLPLASGPAAEPNSSDAETLKVASAARSLTPTIAPSVGNPNLLD